MIFPVLLMGFLVVAVFGVIPFEKYTNSNTEGLHFKDDFKDLPSAFITLFRIFTLEHWFDLLKDIKRVSELNHHLCGLFIMVCFAFGALMNCIFMTLIIDDFECWREDNLCRYFELMEKLQRNLEETSFRIY